MDSEQDDDSSCSFIWKKTSFKVCCITHLKEYPEQKVCTQSHNELISNTSLLLDYHHELWFLPSFSSYLWVHKTFPCLYGLQWICWVKQCLSAHPQTFLSELLPWKLRSTVPHYFFSWTGDVPDCTLWAVNTTGFLCVCLSFPLFTHGSYSVFRYCSVAYSLKRAEKISGECRFAWDSVSPSLSFHLLLSLVYTTLFQKTWWHKKLSSTLTPTSSLSTDSRTPKPRVAVL